MTHLVDSAPAELRRRAVAVLTSPDLEALVEMVVESPAPDQFRVAAVDGAISFARRPGSPREFDVVTVEGRNPLANQDPAHFGDLAAEQAAPQPHRTTNSYPLAFERIAQVFDHPCAPDLCVLHTAAHRPAHHRGEHGSLDVIQSRAPFVAAGPGLRRDGLVDGHARTIDLAPTVLAAIGIGVGEGIGPDGKASSTCHLARQDGRVLDEIFEEGTAGGARAERAVVVLMDGANANALYEAAGRGDMPHVASLIARGTALRQGCFASLPTVTLANHTTLNTGVHPGHHGVLHNAWYDRELGRQVVTESPSTWAESMQWLFPGIETIHEALKRRRPGALSISVNEPADRGANYSTMGLMRDGRVGELYEGLSGGDIPGADAHFVADSDDYRWGALVDASAALQFAGIVGGSYLGVDYPELPTFAWVSFSLTDAAFHEGGPYGDIALAALRETDARLGIVLGALEAAGALETTAVFIVADHGMEENDADCLGDWGDALRAAGIPHRDEATGFLYLGGE